MVVMRLSSAVLFHPRDPLPDAASRLMVGIMRDLALRQ